jgi:hypothetical protein
MMVLGMVGGWLCRGCFHADKTPIVQRDTLVRVDTIREDNPILIKESVIDTMLVVLRDTIRLRDTLFLSLPLEKKIYGSSEYYAEVSGYRPSLDYIEVFPKTKIITERIVEKRKMNSLSAGVELGYMSALSIPIYLEYERMLHKNIGINAQIFYDLPTRQVGVGVGVKAQMEW